MTKWLRLYAFGCRFGRYVGSTHVGCMCLQVRACAAGGGNAGKHARMRQPAQLRCLLPSRGAHGAGLFIFCHVPVYAAVTDLLLFSPACMHVHS